MGKSLRWRLLLWQTVILLTVLAGFGSVLFFVSYQARLDEIDADLVAAARVLEGSLRALPRPMLAGELLPPHSGPFRPPRPREGRPDGPPNPPSPHEFLERAVEFSPQFQQRYHDVQTPPYFIVWCSDGTVLKKRGRFGGEMPDPRTELRNDPSASWLARQRGPLREIILRGPERTLILVGRSIEPEIVTLHHLGWIIALTGLSVFLVGLASGWWLTGRAVRPIHQMSATAATITASNLSRRIDLANVDTEMGQLANILNAMLDRLEESFTQQVRFTADASHELRTPLAVILSHAELALGRERTSEEYRQAIATCQRAALRMRSLVDALLELARMDSGELKLNLQPLDWGSVAQEVADQLRPLAEARGLRLDTDLPTISLLGDEERLMQVITNLVTNAIQYNRAGGRIALSLSEADQHAVLTVTDNGIGIPAEDVPHLFERFYRVDKARSRAVGGNGLGLAICKSIIDAHGGTIEVKSEVNDGSTFVVRLPRECHVEKSPTPVEAEQVETAGKST